MDTTEILCLVYSHLQNKHEIRGQSGELTK
jgi:hypothetical protein